MILSSPPSPGWPCAIAFVAYVLAGAFARPPQEATPGKHPLFLRLLWVCAWLSQGLSIVWDAVHVQGHNIEARFGFAPALSVTSWLVLAVYALERPRVELPTLQRWLAWLTATSVALAAAYPGEAFVGAGLGLAPLHWLTGFASYGLIATAVLHATLLSQAERRLRAATQASGQIGGRLRPPGRALGMPLLRLEDLTMRFVAAGFAMLSLTLLLAAAFASPWHWDHKSVFSILSWLVFAILLIGRWRFGWRGQQAMRWLLAGSAFLLLAYVGSRFVLEVVLHRQLIS